MRGVAFNKAFWAASTSFFSMATLTFFIKDYYSGNTLYIIPIKGKEKDLELFAHKWFGADEIEYCFHNYGSRFIWLTDDNFASIVAAVEEGRGIFQNIKKYLIYLLNKKKTRNKKKYRNLLEN
jgi:hypothetical protein